MRKTINSFAYATIAFSIMLCSSSCSPSNEKTAETSASLPQKVRYDTTYMYGDTIIVDNVDSLMICNGDTIAHMIPQNAAIFGFDRDVLIKEVCLSPKRDTLYAYPPIFMGGDYVIPSTVKFIADRAFYSCQYIHSLVVPASVEDIGTWVTAGCPRLERLTFQCHMDQLPWYCLAGLDNLKELHLADTNPPGFAIQCVDSNGRIDTEIEQENYGLELQDIKNAVVYVPRGSMATYKRTAVWRLHKHFAEE